MSALVTNSETFSHKCVLRFLALIASLCPGKLTHSSRSRIVLNPTLLKIADEVLHVRNKLYLDTEPVWCNSKPQINVTTALEIHPGATSQALHRYRSFFSFFLVDDD